MRSTGKRRTFRERLRGRGMWLNADKARVILRAVERAHISATEPGADVVKRFLRRCEELDSDA